MKNLILIALMGITAVFSSCAQKPLVELTDFPNVIMDSEHYNELTPKEAWILQRKGTEPSFTGAFHNHKGKGVYICKQCNNPLFKSEDKFNSGTGWPSYDDAIPGAVSEHMDGDGYRTEIVCSNCDGHLGHVFRGEGFTEKQTRHCVNSLSLNFVSKPWMVPVKQEKPKTDVVPIAEYIAGKGYEDYAVAIFAGGCFWCTEASFERIEGVVDVISGYSGGKKQYPTYQEVGGGATDHAEAIIIYYDPAIIDYNTLLDIFFVAHDPTQLNRQGPDVGRQYRSTIFYQGPGQKSAASAKIKVLNKAGTYPKKIVTTLEPYQEFWVAEAYHQDYYELHPDNRYITNVSKPKVEKVKKVFAQRLKDKYSMK